MNPTNIKPFIYVGILAVIAVAGLGYYLMPEKVAYQPSSVLEDDTDEAVTPPNTSSSTPIQNLPVPNPNTPISNPQPVACTMDAMMCPDGSYVGRSGPNCQFVCPATSQNQSNNIVRTEWGIRMTKADGWNVLGYQEPSVDGVSAYFQLENVQGEYKGDKITIKHWPNVEYIKNSDNKFGNVEYYWDKTKSIWKTNFHNEIGEWIVGENATPLKFTQDNLPVFSGRTRWRTYIVPLDKNRFLEMNITGSGDTAPLDALLNTLKVIERG